MRHFFKAVACRITSNQSALFFIIMVAFALRIYRLDTPSLWGDELICPVMASKPLEYLLRWNWLEDVHPPTYHLIIKLIMLVSESDFALRFPSMVLGVISIFLIYRIGKTWLGEQGGLLAASILAISSPHIYLSRVVRFYSTTIVLCLVGIMLLTQFMNRRDKSTMLWFVIVLGALLLAEFTSVMPIVAFAVAMIAVIFSGQDRIRTSLRFLLYGFVTFIIPGSFLIATALQRKNYSGTASLRAAVDNFLAALAWLAAGFGDRPSNNTDYWVIVITASLCLVGAIYLAFNNKRLLGICLSFPLCGLLVILFIRPGYCLAFWHLYYLIPVIALLEASAVLTIIPARFCAVVAVLVSLAGAVQAFTTLRYNMYLPASYGPDIREIGRTVASEVLPGSATVINTMDIDFVNWYADRFCLINRIKEQHITADTSPLTINLFLERKDTLGHLVSPSSPVSSWAEIIQPMGRGNLVKAVVPRSPLTPLNITGVAQEFDAHPGRFYKSVYSADRVMIYPYWGNMAISTMNDTPSAFKYVFVNPDGYGNKYIVLKVHYRNKGVGNIFKAWAQFDGEKPVEFVQSTGPEAVHQDTDGADYVERVVSFRRENPFTHLTVGFDIVCALITPHYPTSNLGNTGFKRLFITTRPYGPDLMDESALDPNLELAGFNGVERDGNRSWRWAIGPQSSISFTTAGNPVMRLTYAMINPMNNQSYLLTINGDHVGGEKEMPAQSWAAEHHVKVVEFTAKPGKNIIRFQFNKINHVNDSFSETDSSPYTMAFKVLRLEAVPAGSQSSTAPPVNEETDQTSSNR